MPTVKLVPFELIIQIMDNACKEYGVKRSESQILDALLLAFPTALVQDKKYVAYDDVILFMDNWIKALKTKDFNFLTQRRGLRCDPVDIEEFIDSKEYLNQSTQIRPAIKTKMLELYDPTKYYPEVIMTGATGIGKDYMAYLIIARTLYELWCYYNPQVEFGLAAGTSMVIAIQSITKELAKKVTFDELVGTVLRPSKFFQEKYNWDKTVTTELRFPNNVFVRPFSGEDNSALGMAIFAACFPGEQEYLCVGNAYESFGNEACVRVMTSDGSEVFTTETEVPSIKTGAQKELLRLWFGDTFIDCTPNQRFKDENNEWIEAEKCRGVRLLSCNMSYMRQESNLYGTTFTVSAQDEDKGIPGTVSRRFNLQSENDSKRSEEDGDRFPEDYLQVVRYEFSQNKYNAPKEASPRDDSERVSGAVPWRTDGHRKHQEKNCKELCKTHVGAAKVSCLQSEVAGTWEKALQRGCPFRGMEEKVVSRTWIQGEKNRGTETSSSKVTHECKKERLRGHVKKYKRITLGSCKRVGFVGVTISKGQRRIRPFPLQKGAGNSLLAGLFGDRLGIRGNRDCVFYGRGGSCLYPGLYNTRNVYRGENGILYGYVHQTGRTNNSSIENKAIFTLNKHNDAALQDNGYSVQLSEFSKNTGDELQGASRKISTVVCTKVERLTGTYTVYDLKDVPVTNTVIVPTKDKQFHLLAHNCVNEMSFMKVIAKSKKAGNAANQEYNQAARIYRTLSRRIKGRFNKYGKVPGKMVLISSAKEEGDFISSRLNELESISPEERAKVFVLKMSQWESLAGLDRLTLETFLVEKGDNTKQSRIIKSREEALEEADVIEVPMDYYGEFEKDIDGALADIAGEFISGSRKKFIPYKEDILKAAQAHTEATGGSQLFLKDSIIFDKLVDPYNPDYSRIVNLEYIKDILTPNNQYAAHIDYGFTGDATGIAIGHIASYKLIQAAKVYDPVTNGYKEINNTHLPVFFIDGVLQVYASSGSEVDIDFVEGLIYYLKEHLNIQWVTFDSYESRSSIQGFKKRKMISGVVSTVSDLEPYTELKNAIKTNRILYPESEMLMKEIRELERTSSGKVDHTVTSTKDVSDSVAAVLHVLMRKAQNLKAGRAFSTEVENNRQSRELPVVHRRSRFARL